jgi:hypothetical protein
VTVVSDVTACEIVSIPPVNTAARPSLEFILQMKTTDGSSGTVVYTTVTPRAPATPN